MDRRTDGQTDRRTDIIAISISRVSVLMRDKKMNSSKSLKCRFITSMHCVVMQIMYLL